jgi:photosystem II stability/assembly factor-like uncharacterized protein
LTRTSLIFPFLLSSSFIVVLGIPFSPRLSGQTTKEGTTVSEKPIGQTKTQPFKKKPLPKVQKNLRKKLPKKREASKNVSRQKPKRRIAPPKLDLRQLGIRNLGPSVMGGRVVDLEVEPGHPWIFYVATASGGVWKTENNGTTFKPVFSHQKNGTVGDIAISPSDPKQIWVGTGEANNRNSTSWGNGVYFSKDGGKHWEWKGLPKSFHIGRIAVHPKDPKTVFVAAGGDLWAPNPERGVYRTKDGGKTWELVLKKDSKTGATEVRIDPQNPNIVYAALYERQRDRFDGNHPAKRWGVGSGLYRSDDGGSSWKKLTKGLPTVKIGRITLDIYKKDPKVVWALIETEWIGKAPKGAKPNPQPGQPGYMGIQGKDGAGGALLTEVLEGGPSEKAGFKKNDLVVEFAGKGTASYEEMIAELRKHKAGEKIKVKVVRGNKSKVLNLTLGNRMGGQRRSRLPYADRIGGQVANKLKGQGPLGFQTGGTFRSEDHGETWVRVNSLNPRPYYFSQIRVDPSDEKHVYVCGIQFHESHDRGKTFRVGARGVHVDFHAMWIDPRDGRHLLLGCDGGVNLSHDRGKTWETFENFDIGQCYHAVADTRRPYWVYAGFQDNGSWGGPSRTPFSDGITVTDWFKVGSGDGFVCRVDREDPNVVFVESQGGNMFWLNVFTGQRGRVRKPRGNNWNWNTPFLLSHFNSKTLLFAGTRVYRSPDRGRSVVAISPKITRLPKDAKTPLGAPSSGPSASALHESPRKPSILWVGSDDGALHVTKDDGKTWIPRHRELQKVLGLKTFPWVSYVFASRYKDGRAYVALDGHRQGDKRPHLAVTEDFGETWKSLSKGLPEGTVRCIYEDSKNPDLLYAGTEFGLSISLDRGEHWDRLLGKFPAVAVHDVDLQEREEHLILGTHGRSIWVLDVRPLRHLTTKERAKPLVLVQPANLFRMPRRSRGRSGNRYFKASNGDNRPVFYYWVGKKSKGPATLTVYDLKGNSVWTGKASSMQGLHRMVMGRSRGAGRRRGRRGFSRPLTEGDYRVVLQLGGLEQSKVFKIENAKIASDVSWPRPPQVGEGLPALEEVEDGNEIADEENERRIR